MTPFAATLSAVAATVAAIFAGFNLYLTGRRELGKWRRESVVDAFVEFLNASFACKDACKSFCNEYRHGGMTEEKRATFVETSEALLAAMRSQLTKLRLLAPPAVVADCKILYSKNREFHELTRSNGDAIHDLRDIRLRDDIRDARNAAVSAAKVLMGIK